MPLTPGTRVGSYEITAALGAGGMGEVYRARDTKLDRDVAIKVLPELFATDPDRLARFEREARALAALNHPNIAHLHGVEDSGGARAIVMELVEGEDLAARGARGPLAPAEALPIARQIAEALETAHEQGIVHRDLKPANIKVRDDGTVKVLDFGLAKALDPPSSSSASSVLESPTVTMGGTALGVILGTAAYMAPEQAKGKPVDRRADIWAFGCILYEMLTGDSPWSGETITDVIAAVVTREPDWSRLPAGIPPAVHRLLRRCLEKDPRRRLRHIGDAVVEIDEALGTSAAPVEEPRPAIPSRRRGTLTAVACGAFALGGLLGALIWRSFQPSPVPLGIARFAVPLPTEQIVSYLNRQAIAISPDGTRVVYTATDGIYVRELGDTEPRRLLARQEAPCCVFFSPDSAWVGFFARDGLMKLPLAGGTPQVLVRASGSTPAMGAMGAIWSEDGTIVYASEAGMHRVAAAGGAPELLFAREQPTIVAWPQVLPGGRELLYNEAEPGLLDRAVLVISALDGTGRQELLRNVANVRYVSTGHLVFGREGRLFAVRFDRSARRVIGTPWALPEAPRTSQISGVAQISVSDEGTLAYVPSTLDQDTTELVWVKRDGEVSPASRVLRQHSDPRLSPDGRKVALHLQDEANDVWVHDLERGTLTRLTFDPAEDETPVWSPDGRYVAYAATRGGTRMIFRRAPDGSTAEQRLWSTAAHVHVMDWSPDGRTLLLELQNLKTGSDLVLLDVETRQTRTIFDSPFNENFGRFSPDGRLLAYGSNESGRSEVYVQPFPALDARVQISTDGGGQPVWSRNGRELFYRGPTHVMSVRLLGGSPPEFSSPQPLFADRFEHPQAGSHVSFDVAPDGRFLMVGTPARADRREGRRAEFHIVLNWATQLTRRPGTQN